jgi:murein L,D-transpeptidase YcbB/YkuD
MTGDLAKNYSTGEIFDQNLKRALKRFQGRHGLAATGDVDPETLSALNVPVSQRIRQMEESLVKMGDLPADLGRRFILVNIPEHWLYVFEENRLVMRMKVVVGRMENPTPTLSSTIDHFKINPAWVVPKSALEQTLAAARAAPDYIDARNIQVFKGWGGGESEVDPRTINWAEVSTATFQYHLRQQPGPANPLGRLEFIFPNKYGIHLHDTPARQIFDEMDRARSLGCVRVEKAVTLAAYLLKGRQGWGRERILQEIKSGASRTVWLDEPIGVHIVYWNAWINSNGKVEFRDAPPALSAASVGTR